VSERYRSETTRDDEAVSEQAVCVKSKCNHAKKRPAVVQL
jgi:hypothetical protein